MLISPVKKSSHLNQERNIHRSSTVYKWKLSKPVLNKCVGGFWCTRTTGDRHLEEALLLRNMYLYFGQKQWFKVQTLWWWICFLQTHRFVLHKMLTDGLEWCGLLVDYCGVFISCLDYQSDGTHSLQRIHWWASDVMLNFSQSVAMKKKNDLHLGWPECEDIFNFFFIFVWTFPQQSTILK